MRLFAPNGAQAVIFSRTGLNTSLPNGDDSDLVGPYRFFDNNSNNWWSAATAANSATAIPAGSYRSSNPGGPGETGINTLITPAFAGVSNPNGTWTLKFQDVAGSDSGSVSAAELTVLEGADTSAPPAPTMTSTDPASPAQSTTPKFKGSAVAGTFVRLHTDPFTCTAASVVATGTPAEFAGSGISVNVGSGDTLIAASTMDASGNVSGCSGHLTYSQDSVPPAELTTIATDPASPANNSVPKIKGSGAESGSTVKIYDLPNCAPPEADSGAAADFNGAGIEVEVPDDSTNTFTVTATDAAGNASPCSDPITYVEDSSSPTPTITASDPASPANNNLPKLKGDGAEAGATITVYKGSDCTGSFQLGGTAAQFNGAGVAFAVTDDTSEPYRVTATDALGNVSGCSNPVTYTEDSTAPATPSLSATDPGSASNQNSPKVKGGAEAGSQVRLFTSTDCSGAPAGTGSAGDLGAPGIATTVPDNATTQLRATATDAAGNASGCSAPISYAEDSTAPETSATTPKAKVKAKKKSAKVRFAVSSPDASARIECRLDDAAFAACGSAPEFKLKTGKHTLEAVAIDAAGNRDQSPASVKVKVVRKNKKR